MPIIADNIWLTPPEYLIERSAFWGIAWFSWRSCIQSAGPDIYIKELLFGGYRLRMTLDSSFWDHTGSAWRHDQILTNLYGMAPGSSTPASTGPVNRFILYYPDYRQYIVGIQSVGTDNDGCFFRFTPATDNAGSPLVESDLPPVWQSRQVSPGVIFPPSYC